MQKKLIVIAKCFDSSTSGPANIVRGLINEFENEHLPYVAILFKEENSKRAFLREVVKVLREEQGAIVNVHTEGFLIPLMVYLCSIFFRKHSYYLTVHGIYKIEADMEKAYSRKYVLVEKFLYKYFQNLVCVSHMLKNDIKNMYGRMENVIVIPNATDAHSNEIFVPRKVKEIISLGGLRRCKGIEDVLQLANVIKQRILPIHISVYGVAEENLEWFMQQSNDKELNSIVVYRGLIQDKNELYDIIRRADAQICLSHYDTYNVAIAESLVLGCPCIATDRCGASYLIKNKRNGFVINESIAVENDFCEVTEYILSLDSATRREVEEDMIYYSNMLSWKNVVKLYSELQ